MSRSIKIHVLHCGYIQVSPAVPFGNTTKLAAGAKQMLVPENKRLTLPCSAYLIEHPRGLILVDTGWCREISPNGVYDAQAVKRVLPAHLAAMYRPYVPEGMAIHEQLEQRGIRPKDLDMVLLTTFNPAHLAGVRHVKDAKRILVAETEYFWNCRFVYQLRQPKSLFEGIPMEHFWFRGSALGTNRWAYDVLEDETLMCVNVPGNTEGMSVVLVQNGELLEHKREFAVLASDTAFAHRNWAEMITPGVGFDRDAQLNGLKWLKQQEALPGCKAILPTHDPDIQPQTITIPLPDRVF